MKILIVKRDETDLFRIHNHQMCEVLMSNQNSSNYLRTIYELLVKIAVTMQVKWFMKTNIGHGLL